MELLGGRRICLAESMPDTCVTVCGCRYGEYALDWYGLNMAPPFPSIIPGGAAALVAAMVKPGQRHGNDGQRDGNAAGGHGKAPAHGRGFALADG